MFYIGVFVFSEQEEALMACSHVFSKSRAISLVCVIWGANELRKGQLLTANIYFVLQT